MGLDTACPQQLSPALVHLNSWDDDTFLLLYDLTRSLPPPPSPPVLSLDIERCPLQKHCPLPDNPLNSMFDQLWCGE